ncbi:hypothetical protein [Porphyromonas circumdentaria]|uniref:Uncharacterized protein n=1 Tax=Porphyromonas circumdentaria TaxID=29524 RepID=A0A1T4NXV8_9PORP|nr:hypothetical protein [Porphyromonas circumdentaria]MBB6276226.1 hypothetical protein [Porphyromonas circumdentaria]SJZ84041.1 hypothetical protein SAMN02745171_01259 [Porphyromonas circumdentaria]
MSELLIVIALLGSVKWIMEEGLHTSFLVRGGHAVLYLLFILWTHYVSMDSSLTTLQELLYTPTMLRDISLFIMVDLLYVVYLCTRNRTPSSKWYKRLSTMLPSLLFFPVLFYIRLKLFYLLPGYSFFGVTIVLMVLVVLITLFAPVIGRFIMLSIDTSKELSILLSLALFFIAVAAGAMHPDSQVRGTGSEVDWLQVGLLVLAVLLFAFVGYIGRRLYPIIKKRLKS